MPGVGIEPESPESNTLTIRPWSFPQQIIHEANKHFNHEAVTEWNAIIRQQIYSAITQ